EVALGVLDHLGGLGHLDAAGLVGASGDDAGVEGVDEVGGLWGGAGGDFEDVGEAVGLVARVDAFGGVAYGESAGFARKTRSYRGCVRGGGAGRGGGGGGTIEAQ